MLRDRCPKIVNHALKWQKAKEKWIDHAYAYFIKIIGEERDIDNNIIRTATENKRAVMTILLGLKKGKPKNFDFERTINWDDLTDEESAYWKRISSWVKWFGAKYAYIKNAYDISKKVGKSDLDIRIEIINGYLGALMPSQNASEEERQAKYDYVDKLVDFLITCFENENDQCIFPCFGSFRDRLCK